MKVLIGISSSEHTTYNVSSGHGDRVTDKLLVQDSGFLSIIEPNAHLMADRGFKIRDFIFLATVQIYPPPPRAQEIYR